MNVKKKQTIAAKIIFFFKRLRIFSPSLIYDEYRKVKFNSVSISGESNLRPRDNKARALFTEPSNHNNLQYNTCT